MRKLRCIALMLLFSLLLVSCSGAGEAYLYDNGAHTHVYGSRYDVTPATCVSEGSEIRYCKICHASVTDAVSVPSDIAVRKHAFSDTVIAPTECAEGYTVKSCTLCPYVIDRTNVIPALYALLTNEATATVAPLGTDSIVMSDTETHVLTYDVGREAAISAALARRLAVALVIVEEMAREGSTLTPDSEITLTSGIGAGNSYTVRDLFNEWAASGDPDIARGFAAALDGSEAAFSARVGARLQRLGVGEAVTVDPFSTTNTGTATLGATAVMLARALDEELIVAAFAAAVPGLIKIAGEKPVLYFTDTALRASVLKTGERSYRFLLLSGNDLPTHLENTLFTGV